MFFPSSSFLSLLPWTEKLCCQILCEFRVGTDSSGYFWRFHVGGLRRRISIFILPVEKGFLEPVEEFTKLE
jgi:hypothetical protein